LQAAVKGQVRAGNILIIEFKALNTKLITAELKKLRKFKIT